MAKGVFTTRITPAYDDVPEERYHFPRTYLRQVEAVLGDWIVYYEPRRAGAGATTGGRQAYFATARVTRLIEDPANAEHYYAHVSDYLTFSRAVPFRATDGLHMESSLRRDDGETNKGAFGRAVRLLAEIEFDAITRLGFAYDLVAESKAAGAEMAAEFSEASSSPLLYGSFSDEGSDFVRPIIERVVARPFRDTAFRHQVQDAYDKTCAITGLRLINGGGRPEVQAAHIKSVAANGPDSVRNGIALSGTIHWLFDRGHVTIDQDYRLIAPEPLIPKELRPLIRNGHKIRLPGEQSLWPHQRFLEHHRHYTFKG